MNFAAITAYLNTTSDYGMFSTNVTTKDWIIYRYGQVWAQADWPFKWVPPASLAVTGGVPTVAAPAACFKPIFLFDDQDSPLTEIAPIEFFRQFGTLAATSSGRPTHYCFINGTFFLGPTPNQSATFQLVYERDLFVFAADGTTVVAGPWDGSTTTQQPCWDASFHFILVHGAAASGYGMMGSPLEMMHEQLFQDGIQKMISFYAPFDHRSNYQFSRDAFS